MDNKKTSTINIRVEEDLKENTNKLFNELGLTMSSAITLFLKASIRTDGIPFDIQTDDKINKK